MELEQPGTQDSAVVEDSAADDEAVELDESSLGTDDESDSAEETDEVEVDGKKYALPKSAADKLKTERLMHGDYTRKTQDVAEEKRQVAAERQEVQRQAAEHQQFIADIADVKSIEKQIQAFQGVDWPSLIDQDPVAAMKYQNQLRGLEQSHVNAVNQLNAKRQQSALNEQQVIAKQAQEADAYLSREIVGWSAERSNQLLKYGTDEGIPSQELSRLAIRFPAIGKLLHKAELYDQISKKPPPVAKPAQQAKPASKVGSPVSIFYIPLTSSNTSYSPGAKRGSIDDEFLEE